MSITPINPGQHNTIGYFHSVNATPGAQEIDYGTRSLYIANGAITPETGAAYGCLTAYGVYNGRFKGTGKFQVMSGTLQSIAQAQTTDFMPSALRLLNTSLTLGSDNTLAETIPYVHELGGYLNLMGDQTFKSATTTKFSQSTEVAGMRLKSRVGGIRVAEGKTVTIGGAASSGGTGDTFEGRIDGEGSFAKDGANYTLNLNGTSRYKGSTHVKAGTLNLASDLTAASASAVQEGDVVRLDFEDPRQLGRNAVPDGPQLAPQGNVAPVQSEGVIGRGVYFDRVGTSAAGLSFGSSTANSGKLPGPADDWTVCTWFKPDPRIEAPDGWEGIFLHGDWSNTSTLRWLAFSNNEAPYSFGQRCIYTNADGKKDSWVFAIENKRAQILELTNDWHHVAVTCRDMKRTIYLDGIKMKEDATALPVPLAITNSFIVGNGFIGHLDEFVYAKRAWTQDEIQAEIHRVKAAVGEAHDPAEDLPAPVAHWAFEDPENIGKDSSGNGYDLEPFAKVSQVVLTEGRPGAHGRYSLLLNNGTAYGYLSNNYGALKLKGDVFPAKIPTGAKSFTVSIRYQCPYETGYTMLYWGGQTMATNRYFRVKDGSQPHSSRADFWNMDTAKYHDGSVFSSCLMGAHNSEANWLHMVYTYDATTHYMDVYVDGAHDKHAWIGVSVNGATSYPNIMDEVLYVGYAPFIDPAKDSNSRLFAACCVDDIRIYDSVLTPEQVRVLTQSLETGSVGPTLPAGTDLTVDAGAKVSVSGAGHVFGRLEGSGTLEISGLARVTVTNSTTFPGALAGAGAVRGTSGATLSLANTADFAGDLEPAGGVICVSDAARGAVARLTSAGGRVTGDALACTATLEDGIAISTDSTGTGLPLISTTGRVIVPAKGSLVLTGKPKASKRLVLAQGGSLDLPATLEGWTCDTSAGNGAYSVRFEVCENNTQLTAKISVGGLLVIVK